MMGGVHLKRPDRFSSCASLDLYLIPYLIKQASLFHATGSGVPREVVTVKTGEKPIQGPGNSWQTYRPWSHSSLFVLNLFTRAFAFSGAWDLGPRLLLSFLTIARTAYRKLN